MSSSCCDLAFYFRLRAASATLAFVSVVLATTSQKHFIHSLGWLGHSPELLAAPATADRMSHMQPGNVDIVNREKLEQAACPCYKIIEDQNRKWQAEAARIEDD
jgi:hypothetical protein